MGGNLINRTRFENLRVYQLAEEIADLAWDVVTSWDRLPQETVGRQLINSSDSIGANIAEGAGRGSAADNRRFAKIARGSLFEVKHWLRRAYKRKLLSERDKFVPEIDRRINSQIECLYQIDRE